MSSSQLLLQGVFRINQDPLSLALMQYLGLGTQACGSSRGSLDIWVTYLYLSRHQTRPFILPHNVIAQKSVQGSAGQAFVSIALMGVALWPLVDERTNLRV